jgi:hypothetical protein
MSRFRSLILAAMLTAAPFAASAGQAGSTDSGTHIYSPSPLIVQTNAIRQVAALPHNKGQNATRQKPVRIADASSAGTSIYQPVPLTTMTHQQRLIAEINQTYGTSFPVHPENEALALNNR